MSWVKAVSLFRLTSLLPYVLSWKQKMACLQPRREILKGQNMGIGHLWGRRWGLEGWYIASSCEIFQIKLQTFILVFPTCKECVSRGPDDGRNWLTRATALSADWEFKGCVADTAQCLPLTGSRVPCTWSKSSLHVTRSWRQVTEAVS